MSSMLKLETEDGVLVDVGVEVIQCSHTIRLMLEDLGCGEEIDENEVIVIPLPRVCSAILHKIIAWAKHHDDDPPPLEDIYGNHVPPELDEWDAEFLNLDEQTLLDLAMAAIFLDIPDLLKTIAQVMLNIMEARSPEHILQLLNSVNGL
ncbi:S-phase kinase-associated protein 1 [Folsomia candida]|uniref:E3 ubiquitin ligase complex SCF subunit sconC n=1 Tax=Folsomia candida TaxID=158441 RepID=A0A226DK55_FOLCA|nr:S-phase kinase-associated protein 1 [Folsomia candida]OXA45490.1 E3 ubiquitin ligase complex SCF subunit sconC [Folsomia candida]